MKANKTIALLFAASCLSAAIASNSLLGVGIWFWIILASGVFVAASQFLPVLNALGAAVASSLATISVIAVLLTLLAATIGGSFELGTRETLLVFSFVMIAVFGFILAALVRRKHKQQISTEEEAQ